jgi:hypothetical protein
VFPTRTINPLLGAAGAVVVVVVVVMVLVAAGKKAAFMLYLYEDVRFAKDTTCCW